MMCKEEIRKVIEILIEETKLAIALKNMCTKLISNKEFSEAFNNTYEAHGFNLIRDSLTYTLVLTIMRLYDSLDREDTCSLKYLFERILDSDKKIEDAVENSVCFKQAKREYKEIKASHLIARTKAMRHHFIAHKALSTGKEKFPQYQDLYDIVDNTTSLINNLSIGVCGCSLGLEDLDKHWQCYALKLCESMIRGQNMPPICNQKI